MASILWGYADLPQELNTSKHRVETPMRILQETGRHQCKAFHISHLQNPSPAPEVKAAIDEAQIIVLERLLLKELQPRIDEWHKAGKFVAATFDDNYALMPPSGMDSFNTWKGGKKAIVGRNADGSDKLGSILGEFRSTLRAVDTALVPSRVLADDYRQFCPTIQFCPNVPYLPLWQNLKKRPMDNNVEIIWGGSTAHNLSWRESGLPQALGLICKKYPRVHLHLQSKDASIMVMLDKANVRYDSHFWVPFESWPSVVTRADLGVAPLTADGYDLRRSCLKSFEYALGGMPWVATEGPVYAEAKGGVLVPNRATDWADAIASLIDDRDKRERLAREGREWAVGLYEGAAEMYERALGIGG